MRLTLVTAVVAALLLLCSPAHSTTLEATSGTVFVFIESFPDPGVNPGGASWSLNGWSGTSWIGQLQVSSTFHFYAHRLVIDGVVYQSPSTTFLNDSIMTITHDPADLDPFPSILVPGFKPFSLPFSMTAQVPLLGGGVDLAGHGILTVDRFGESLDNSTLTYTYQFVASEAETALLLTIAMLALRLAGRADRMIGLREKRELDAAAASKGDLPRVRKPLDALRQLCPRPDRPHDLFRSQPQPPGHNE